MRSSSFTFTRPDGDVWKRISLFEPDVKTRWPFSDSIRGLQGQITQSKISFDKRTCILVSSGDRHRIGGQWAFSWNTHQESHYDPHIFRDCIIFSYILFFFFPVQINAQTFWWSSTGSQGWKKEKSSVGSNNHITQIKILQTLTEHFKRWDTDRC